MTRASSGDLGRADARWAGLTWPFPFHRLPVLFHIVQNAVFRYAEPVQGMADECGQRLNFWLNDFGRPEGTESFRFRYSMRPGKNRDFWKDEGTC